MDKVKDIKQPDAAIELMARETALSKANVARWGLNIAVLLIALLVTIIILISQGVDINIVSILAICGLGAVWFMGRRRGRQLYHSFYAEELLKLQQNPSMEAVTPVEQLTPRELQILNYMAKGYANKLIALELGISQNTVRNFISGVLRKLNARDRTEATVIAIKRGFISIK